MPAVLVASVMMMAAMAAAAVVVDQEDLVDLEAVDQAAVEVAEGESCVFFFFQ